MPDPVSAPRGPLAHLRVLDLSVFAQGALAGQILGELGADVIKVERPGRGDPGRALSNFGDGHSAFFEPLNRGKRGMVIDLARADGREVLLRLAEGADVFLHNSSVGALERIGLGYEDLRARNPSIVYGHGTGLGEHGPDATRDVVDIIGQARGGLASVTGQSQPVPAGAILSDNIGGLYLLVGILAALVHREHTGEGQKVESSMLGALIAAQAWELSNYLFTGNLPTRGGRGHPLLRGLWGVYEASDGFLALTGVNPDAWPAFCDLIGARQLLDDDRFASAELRQQHASALADVVAAEFVRFPTVELVDNLLALGLRCTAVNDYAAVAADPQVQVNGYIVEVDHPRLGRVRVPANPIHLSKTPATTPAAAPRPGEHTVQLLGETGYSPDEITRLRATGVVP